MSKNPMSLCDKNVPKYYTCRNIRGISSKNTCKNMFIELPLHQKINLKVKRHEKISNYSLIRADHRNDGDSTDQHD